MSGNYKMGEYRYRGHGCLTAITVSPKETATEVEGNNFTDVMFVPTSSFQQNKDYRFHVDVPQSSQYSMDFTFKLVQTNTAGDGTAKESTYQYIGEAHVPQSSMAVADDVDVTKVAVMCRSDLSLSNLNDAPVSGDGKKFNADNLRILEAAVISDNDQVLESGKLYANLTNGYVYLGNDAVASDSSRVKYAAASVLSTSAWQRPGISDAVTQDGEKTHAIDVTFRPVQDGFTGIVMQMERTTLDTTMSYTVNGEKRVGRRVDVSSIEDTTSLESITNLIPSFENNLSQVESIGVWGHPGLMMCVNGEAIRIGRSGVWESASLPIKTFGVVAESYKDNFTVDYVYKEQGV